MCSWVTMLYSRKLTQHCKPAIMDENKNHYIFKKKRKNRFKGVSFTATRRNLSSQFQFTKLKMRGYIDQLFPNCLALRIIWKLLKKFLKKTDFHTPTQCVFWPKNLYTI